VGHDLARVRDVDEIGVHARSGIASCALASTRLHVPMTVVRMIDAGSLIAIWRWRGDAA
jgi:hypothetical protein